MRLTITRGVRFSFSSRSSTLRKSGEEERSMSPVMSRIVASPTNRSMIFNTVLLGVPDAWKRQRRHFTRSGAIAQEFYKSPMSRGTPGKTRQKGREFVAAAVFEGRFSAALRRRKLQRRFAQPQGVRDNRDGTEAHRRAGNHGAKQPAEQRIENAGSNRNTERIVQKSKSQILPNIADRRLAQPPRPENPAQIPFKQNDSGVFDGHIRAAAHGDANVRGRQRGRVVDAVASHRYDSPFAAQAMDDLRLFFRANFGFHFVDAYFTHNRSGGFTPVSREHDD